MKMKTTNSRLVITGMGAVTPIGIGVENYWKNLVAGKCGVEEITRFDTEELPVKIAAEVKDFNAEDFMPKKLTREMDVFMQYGYQRQWAIADAGEITALGAWVSSLALAVFHRLQRCRMD
ncbi:MAG: beta-ketoacyl synthase N-terminal-like domain-containing protein [Clostridium sp.]